MNPLNHAVYYINENVPDVVLTRLTFQVCREFRSIYATY